MLRILGLQGVQGGTPRDRRVALDRLDSSAPTHSPPDRHTTRGTPRPGVAITIALRTDGLTRQCGGEDVSDSYWVSGCRGETAFRTRPSGYPDTRHRERSTIPVRNRDPRFPQPSDRSEPRRHHSGEFAFVGCSSFRGLLSTGLRRIRPRRLAAIARLVIPLESARLVCSIR